MSAAIIIAICTALGFSIDVILWRIRYTRWLDRGRAIAGRFDLWVAQRRTYLDPQVSRSDQMTPLQRDHLRREIESYLRWADDILEHRAEWERSAP